MAHLGMGAILGTYLCYLTKFTGSDYYLTKGFLIGLFAWLILLGGGTILHMPVFYHTPPGPSLTVFITSIVWGIITIETVKLLGAQLSSQESEVEDKVEITFNQGFPIPARKPKDGNNND